MRTANFFFDKPIEQTAEEYEKMLEIEDAQVCLLLRLELPVILTVLRRRYAVSIVILP